jgi:hypothetical protein
MSQTNDLIFTFALVSWSSLFHATKLSHLKLGRLHVTRVLLWSNVSRHGLAAGKFRNEILGWNRINRQQGFGFGTLIWIWIWNLNIRCCLTVLQNNIFFGI